jgi:Flp pilus assembly protein TadG
MSRAMTAIGTTANPKRANLLRRLARDRRGVSAVEFALLAPVMITLYFGCVETSVGVSADRKVSLTAAALANLTAQVSTISSTDMTDILDASTAIIAPYSAADLKVTVSCIAIDANQAATVKWSATRNGTIRSGTISIPSALAVASTQLILAEASYAYTPTVGYTITGTLNLSDKMYMSPRISAPTYGSTTCS